MVLEPHKHPALSNENLSTSSGEALKHYNKQVTKSRHESSRGFTRPHVHEESFPGSEAN